MKANTAFRILGAMSAMTFFSAMSLAQVVDTTGVASINVQVALSLSKVTDPDWGRVTRPPSGTAEYTLNYTTSAVTNSAGDGYAFDDGAAGEFTLTGAASAPVTFAISIGAFSGATPVTVVAAHINGSSNSGTGTLSGGGTLALKLGGILSVPFDASLGAQTATVTVTVDYQ